MYRVGHAFHSRFPVACVLLSCGGGTLDRNTGTCQGPHYESGLRTLSAATGIALLLFRLLAALLPDIHQHNDVRHILLHWKHADRPTTDPAQYIFLIVVFLSNDITALSTVRRRASVRSQITASPALNTLKSGVPRMSRKPRGFRQISCDGRYRIAVHSMFSESSLAMMSGARCSSSQES